MFRRFKDLRSIRCNLFIACILLVTIMISVRYTHMIYASGEGGVTTDNMMGNILDDQENMIVQQTEEGRIYTYPKCYNDLVGIKVRGGYATGLFKKFKTELYTMNYGDKQGSNLYLTCNNEMQKYCYNLLDNSKTGVCKEGSVIILDKENGKIIALAQCNGEPFNANKLTKEKYLKLYEKDNYFLGRGVCISEAVGSTWKAFMAGLMVEHKKEKEEYTDTGSILVNKMKVSNDSGMAWGKLDLQNALIHSSNCYFIHIGLNVLGSEIMDDLEEKFLFNQKIETDVGTIEAEFSLDGSKENLAQTSFGQGKVAMSPLYLAMMYQGLAKGIMMKPYLVEKAVTQRGITIYQAQPEELSRTFDKKVCKIVGEYLKKVATDTYHLDPKLHIRAKTGTATITDGIHHTYVASYDDRFVVVISDQRAKKSSHELAGLLDGIYRKLHEVYDYE